jgi:hypothetical protein
MGRLSDLLSSAKELGDFAGLPERWRVTEPKGALNVYGRIPVTSDPCCSFQAGLFQDTLLPLVNNHDFSPRLVIYLDADLSSSTLFVLTTLSLHSMPDDIIFFRRLHLLARWVSRLRRLGEILPRELQFIGRGRAVNPCLCEDRVKVRGKAGDCFEGSWKLSDLDASFRGLQSSLIRFLHTRSAISECHRRETLD